MTSDVHEEGELHARRIIDKRLSLCVMRGTHYPLKNQPLVYIPQEMLFKPQAPLPANCARCGIGGPYRMYFDNAGRAMGAEVC